MVAVCSIANIIYYIPLSFACALQALVGSQIGLGKIAKAKLIVKLTSIISTVIVVSIIFVIVRYAEDISYVFGGSKERI